ncbi:MAG TPA: GNAT family protein [Thermoplasmata archaeon]|nr:GNAT family protein [Thermoplasmata archaeon]
MEESSFRTPVRLEGRFVELVPLSVEHVPELTWALRNPEVTRLFREPPGSTVDQVEGAVRGLLAQQAAGSDLSFATVLRASGRAIGMTRFLRIDRRSDAVEIGGTFLDSEYWRTPVNTEAKFLMLRHAFETERAHRVQIQTDLRNVRSQKAIERLGAVPEARLREEVQLPDGHFRTSVYYSILETEWPNVKTRLERFLARPWTPPPSTAGPPVLPPRTGAPTGATDREGPKRRPPRRFDSQTEMRGTWVRLVPLERTLLPGLIEAGADPEIWSYMRIRHGDTPEEMSALVEELLDGRARGEVAPYVIRAGVPERTVGIIRYLDIAREDQWVEVGTWLQRSVWRTPVNTEAKFLMLRNAFENEGVHRVQLKTDLRNTRSQEALVRLGAVPEGLMRDHYKFSWGGYRTSLYYSILESEWPGVRERLRRQLERRFTGALAPLAAPA